MAATMLDTAFDRAATLPCRLALDIEPENELVSELESELDSAPDSIEPPALATLGGKEAGALLDLFRRRLVRYECQFAIIELVKPFVFDVASRLLSASAAGWLAGAAGRIGGFGKF